MTLPIFEYTVNADSIEFKLGDVTQTMPKPLQYVKLSNDLSKVYIFSENNDIVFDAKYLPINGFATAQDLYDDLKQYARRTNSGGGGTLQFTDVPLTLNMANVTDYILVDNSNRAIDIVLPNPIDFYNGGVIKKITIKLIVADFSSDDVTIIPFGSEKIDNQINLIFNQPYQSVSLITDGLNWWIV